MSKGVTGKTLAQAVAEAARRAQTVQAAARKTAADIAQQRQPAAENGTVQGQGKGKGN